MSDEWLLIVVSALLSMTVMAYKFWMMTNDPSNDPDAPKRQLPPQRIVILEDSDPNRLSYKINRHLEANPGWIVDIESVSVPGGWTFGPYVKHVATLRQEQFIQNRMEP